MKKRSDPIPSNAPPEPDERQTGLPFLTTWRSVYLAVLGCFAVYVVILTFFARTFS